MTDDLLTPGSFRKRIYDFLRAEGFDLDVPRQKTLSTLIKMACTAQSGEYEKKLGDMNNKLYQREIVFGVRSKQTNAPIHCQDRETHHKLRCYYPCNV